jgi:hypothetical protein
MSVAGNRLWLLVGGVFCLLALLGLLAFILSTAL